MSSLPLALSCSPHRQPLAAPSIAATLGGVRTRGACASAIGKVSCYAARTVGVTSQLRTRRKTDVGGIGNEGIFCGTSQLH